MKFNEIFAEMLEKAGVNDAYCKKVASEQVDAKPIPAGEWTENATQFLATLIFKEKDTEKQEILKNMNGRYAHILQKQLKNAGYEISYKETFVETHDPYDDGYGYIEIRYLKYDK